jgi:hypothetical protein
VFPLGFCNHQAEGKAKLEEFLLLVQLLALELAQVKLNGSKLNNSSSSHSVRATRCRATEPPVQNQTFWPLSRTSALQYRAQVPAVLRAEGAVRTEGAKCRNLSAGAGLRLPLPAEP